jgi:hypothetical protein
MAQTDTKYTSRLAVDKPTQLKASVLAGIRYEGIDTIGGLIRYLVEDAWHEARVAGLVRDSMVADPAQEKVEA